MTKLIAINDLYDMLTQHVVEDVTYTTNLAVYQWHGVVEGMAVRRTNMLHIISRDDVDTVHVNMSQRELIKYMLRMINDIRDIVVTYQFADKHRLEVIPDDTN